MLFVLWRLVGQSTPEMYCFALGAMILVQLVVHMRHFRNLFLFRAAASDAVRGRIEYSRRVILRSSSLELLEFSGLFLRCLHSPIAGSFLAAGWDVFLSRASIGGSHADRLQRRRKRAIIRKLPRRLMGWVRLANRQLLIAVGTAVAGCPPHGPGRALISASGSYLG